jgi:hypothetical protein
MKKTWMLLAIVVVIAVQIAVLSSFHHHNIHVDVASTPAVSNGLD